MSHQGFAVLVDEVLGGLGPFGKNNTVYPFLGDLQATQIEAWGSRKREARDKDVYGLRKYIFYIIF